METTTKTDLGPNYRLCEDPYLANHYFELLKDQVFQSFSQASAPTSRRSGSSHFFCESGWLDGNRRYFYLKPLSRSGWLFERSGFGWVVSRSEKIVLEDLFLRKGEPADLVSLFMLKGADKPRVSSKLGDFTLLGFPRYKKLLLEQLAQS